MDGPQFLSPMFPSLTPVSLKQGVGVVAPVYHRVTTTLGQR